ncbi:MAG: hypothetical protein EP307_01290 [Rhodobacteraceae bacterium]|nr:MAG: hypothetical protein EP307_01290 [Paracoccaceae bacterium]
MSATLIRTPARDQARLPDAPFHTWTGADGTDWAFFHRQDGRILIRFAELADFVVDPDGAQAVCTPAPGCDEGTLDHLFDNQVLPLMLSAQGEMVFHGSAVATEAGAIAFLGQTGRGKSTLAASFATAGMGFLCDDRMVLRRRGADLMVMPAAPSVRLWEDSANRLFATPQDLAPPVSYTDKRRIRAGRDFPHCNQARPLTAAFFLGDGHVKRVRTERLGGILTATSWMANIFLLDTGDKAAIRAKFYQVTAILTRIPAMKLEFPRDHDRLAETRAAILTAAAQAREWT